MPEYLFKYKKFKQLYEIPIVKENDVDSMKKLKMLIEPFILRRTKKEVIAELPDKIEQKIIIDLEKEHKRAYKGYVNLITRKIKENNQDNITVF